MTSLDRIIFSLVAQRIAVRRTKPTGFMEFTPRSQIICSSLIRSANV